MRRHLIDSRFFGRAALPLSALAVCAALLVGSAGCSDSAETAASATADTEDVGAAPADTGGAESDTGNADAAAPCEPVVEECNGKDDDCDGFVDEDFPDENLNGIADCVETDFDGDEIPDKLDNCPKDPNPNQFDKDFDEVGDVCDPDRDGDSVDNEVDNCPDDANINQLDTDLDLIGDACDPDTDNDGVLDEDDNCPLVANPDQADVDGNGQGDVCADKDGDGALDWDDNCPFVTNPSQIDTDGDGEGDECDEDDDGDGVPDATDNCTPGKDEPVNPALPDWYNPDQDDSDNDGTGTKCDKDNDNDGVEDKLDCNPLDPTVSPGAKELCDGVDNDCNGETDEGFGLGEACGDGACAGGEVECLDLNTTVCSTSVGGSDPQVGTDELCNGKDDDCDGEVDEGFGLGAACGLGVCEGGEIECKTETTTVCSTETGGSNQKQVEFEYCNGLDDNCDGVIPELENDLDEDTWRVCDGDCDDQVKSVHPDAKELCDFVDNDCNGEVDDNDICAGSVILGTVTDATTSVKIGGAKVRLLDVLCLEERMTTLTDSEGKYAFPALDGPDNYCVDVDKTGYWITYAEDVIVPPIPWPTVVRVDFGLKPKTSKQNFTGVAGKVTDPDANELDGVDILVDAAAIPIASDLTDAYGNYAIVGLAPNLVNVTASKPGYFPKTSPVILYPNQTMIQNFVLEPFVGASLAGKVTDVNGNKVLDASIVVKAGAEVVGTDTSDKFGYAVSGLLGGEHQATAEKEGYQPASATVTLVEGETTYHDFVMEPLPPKIGCFSDDFEEPSGWLATGLWHTIDNAQNLENIYGCPTCSGAVALVGDWKLPKCQSNQKCLWYGMDSSGSFCTSPSSTGAGSGCSGSSNSGTITSPSITLDDYDSIKLTFWTWWEIESVNPHTYDLLTVQVSAGGGSFQTLGKLNPPSDPVGFDKAKKPFTNTGFDSSPEWQQAVWDLTPYAGKTIQIRFNFGTQDGLYNGFRGWLIDNLVVECE